MRNDGGGYLQGKKSSYKVSGGGRVGAMGRWEMVVYKAERKGRGG